MYSKQLGGILVYRGPMYTQRGYGFRGLAGYFNRFFRWIMPIAEKHVIPHVKNAGKSIGNELVEAGSKIAKDKIRGRKFKESFDEHINTAVDNLKESAKSTLDQSGQGIKRRVLLINNSTSRKSKYKNKKKKTNKDIFA